MSAMIDTLQTAEDLKAAGMPETQAKAVSRVLGGALDGGDLVTTGGLKAALEGLESRLTLKLTAIVGGLLALFKMLDMFVG